MDTLRGLRIPNHALTAVAKLCCVNRRAPGAAKDVMVEKNWHTRQCHLEHLTHGVGPGLAAE